MTARGEATAGAVGAVHQYVAVVGEHAAALAAAVRLVHSALAERVRLCVPASAQAPAPLTRVGRAAQADAGAAALQVATSHAPSHRSVLERQLAAARTALQAAEREAARQRQCAQQLQVRVCAPCVCVRARDRTHAPTQRLLSSESASRALPPGRPRPASSAGTGVAEGMGSAGGAGALEAAEELLRADAALLRRQGALRHQLAKVYRAPAAAPGVAAPGAHALCTGAAAAGAAAAARRHSRCAAARGAGRRAGARAYASVRLAR